MKYNLTNDEANTIKDILLIIGEDAGAIRCLPIRRLCWGRRLFSELVRLRLGMTVDAFNDTTDLIYSKLGNGRIIVKK